MRRFFWCFSAIFVVLLPGCVTVYQPLTSLQRPTVLDPSVANFQGQKILLRCIPGDYVKPPDAQRLCRRVQTLFTGQGAEVDVGGLEHEVGDGRPDLIIELKSRLVHQENPAFMWVACAMTCSVIPAFTEYSFAQDVSIRDPDGFELASDSYQARFVRYTGVGLWAVNKSLDLLVREESEELTGGAHEKDFSKDFYRQLNQLAFNARIRSSVLHGFDDARPAAAKSTQGAAKP